MMLDKINITSKRELSVYKKFILLFTTVAVMIILVTAGLFAFLSARSIKTSINHESKTIIEIAANNIATPLYFSDYQSMDENLSPILKFTEVKFISVYDSVKVLLSHGSSSGEVAQIYPRDPDIAGVQEVFRSSILLVQSMPIYQNKIELGTIYLGYSLDAMNDQLINSIIGAVLLGIVLIWSSFLPIRSFSKRITDPLKDLVTTMEDISGGEHNRRASVKTNDEIGHIAIIFNKMMDEIIKIDLLETALNEKAVLLKEVHHRTKNNMNVIISLLNMQRREMETREIDDVLQLMSDRIKSMSLVHEKLYRGGNFATINLDEYIINLTSQLKLSYMKTDDHISIEYDLDTMEVSLERAIPLGLALNEIITNAYKHGFKGRIEGNIRISLKTGSAEKFILEVSDDGLGLDPGLDIDDIKTMGMHLVEILIKDQLSGELSVQSNGGVHYYIEIPNELPAS